MGYESLDEHVVLLSTYERFAATTAPGVWQEEAVGRTVLFDPTDKAVEEYVSAAGSTGGIGVIPQRLDERVATVYEAQLSRSGMFLVFFGCLLLVLVGTATSAVDALVGSNLRRYAIEQLYGAHTGHVVARVNLFLAAAFSLPTLLIFGLFAVISRNVDAAVPFVAGAVVIIHVALSVRAVVTLSRVSVTSLLRKE